MTNVLMILDYHRHRSASRLPNEVNTMRYHFGPDNDKATKFSAKDMPKMPPRIECMGNSVLTRLIQVTLRLNSRSRKEKQPMTQLWRLLQRVCTKLMSSVPLRLQVSDIIGTWDSKRLTPRQFPVFLNRQTPRSSCRQSRKQDVEEGGWVKQKYQGLRTGSVASSMSRSWRGFAQNKRWANICNLFGLKAIMHQR
jgi:hypothetical protein